MENVSKIALSIISIAFLLALFSAIPLGKNNARMRYVSGVILAAYLVYLTVPIIKIVANSDFLPPEISDTPQAPTEDGEEALIRATSVQICKEIKKLIVNRFGVPESVFTVSVTLERNVEEEIMIKAVTVQCTSAENSISESEAEMIAKYISDTLATECVFIIKPPDKANVVIAS